MFDIAWSEMLVVGVLALLVLGPKELPGLLRTAGQWMSRARAVARDFQRAMDDAARQADVPDVGKIQRDLNQMSRVDFSEVARRSALATQSSHPVATAVTTQAVPVIEPAPAVPPVEIAPPPQAAPQTPPAQV